MGHANDPRTGPHESGQVQVTSGDGTTPQTAVDIPSDALFSISEVIIGYDDGATAVTDVTIYDDADGTSAGNVSDARHVAKNIQPGEVRSIDLEGMRDFEEDVLVQGDGNQDGNLEITVVGRTLIALADVMDA